MARPLDAKPINQKHAYVGRPSISPAVATLAATGQLERHHHVLDAGCGRGTDLIALAELGYASLVGLDYNKASLASARRAAKRRVPRARIEWHWGSLSLLNEFEPASFDWVIDTFLVNNLDVSQEREYARRVARVLKPGGRFLVQCKIQPRLWNKSSQRGLRSRFFRSGAPVLTHYAEFGRRGERSFEPAIVQVLTRKEKG